MLVGYMRVSKADGSQSVNLQRDVLLAAVVTTDQMYEDHASGRADDRPGLASCLKVLRGGGTPGGVEARPAPGPGTTEAPAIDVEYPPPHIQRVGHGPGSPRSGTHARSLLGLING